jgi:protease-4
MQAPTAHHRTPRVLELDLTRGMLESPPTSPVAALRAMQTPVLGQVVKALRDAAEDPRVLGMVAHVGVNPPTLAQADELCAAVAEFRASGKPTWCWSEAFGEVGPGNVQYLLASAFEEIWLQPSGDVGLTGVVAEAVFVRDALDKLGVQPQFGQRHEYKSAADLFMQSHMTQAHRDNVDRLTTSASEHLVEQVATARGMTPEAVRDLIDNAPHEAADALRVGLVDRLGYRDELYTHIEERLGAVHYLFAHRYRRRKPARAVKAKLRRDRPVVAIVPARGPIHLGRHRPGPWSSDSIGSDSLGAALRAAGEADDIRAVVLRVDSPGGSYVASDAIRREVLRLRETGRPVVVSMASVAASGGYYIAMPADVVVANPGTITGSIGVLAGKLVTRDAFERIGIRRESVSVGKYAEMHSTLRPFNDDEWSRLETWLDRVYTDFVGKAADDRGLTPEDMDPLARGRVWTGRDAVEHGLADDLGGLEHAIEVASRRAGVARDEADVRVLPRVSFVERLRPAENSDHVGAAATIPGIGDLESRLLTALGLPPFGVLSLPVAWRLR